MLDTDQLTKDAVHHAEQNGIVFLDEIDKVCARAARAASAAATCRARACSATCCR